MLCFFIIIIGPLQINCNKIIICDIIQLMLTALFDDLFFSDRLPPPHPQNDIKFLVIDLQHKMQQWQQILIDVIGWIYFFAWSFSFYGQIYQNFKIKSVEGMNFDFVAMNLTGFTFYSLYNSYGHFISDDQTGQVDLNDVLFSYHAIFATLLTLTQICCYPKKDNRIHAPTVLYIAAMWIFLIVWTLLTEVLNVVHVGNDFKSISMMGYFKISISFLKYLPQFYWNYKRKSTVGWSIANILLDMTGGLFSFLQMGLQAIFGQDVAINPIKLILGIMVVIYDLLFIVQHYCLYPQSRRNKGLEVAGSEKGTVTGMQSSLVMPVNTQIVREE